MANGSIGTPRVYVDYIQWAKSQGMIESILPYESLAVENEFRDLFDMDPTKQTTIAPTADGKLYIGVYVEFKSYNFERGLDYKQFGYLMSDMNYLGILGHQLGLGVQNTEFFTNYHCGFTSREINPEIEQGWNIWSAGDIPIIGGRQDTNVIGTSLAGQDGFSESAPPEAFQKFRFVFSCTEVVGYEGNGDAIREGRFLETDRLKMGALTAGRYFDFPQDVDLKLSKSYKFEQSQTRRTWGGADLTQTNYKQEDWGGLRKWAHINLDNYTDREFALENENCQTSGFQGKRSWDLSLSYLDKYDLFPVSASNSAIGYYQTSETLGETLIKNNNMDNLGGTLGGVVSDDIAQHWAGTNNPTYVQYSIVTGNGFSTNAQRVTNNADLKTWHLRYEPNNGMQFESMQTYRVEFYYRSNCVPPTAENSYNYDNVIKVGWGEGTLDGMASGTAGSIPLPTNTGDAVKFVYYMFINDEGNTPPTPTTLLFQARKRDANLYLEIDRVRAQKVLTFASNELNKSETMVGRFLTLTHGGNIPFIFQPDNTVNSDFALCIIDQKSINIQRVAPNIYSIKLRIKEI